jgi:hypothetical protein
MRYGGVDVSRPMTKSDLDRAVSEITLRLVVVTIAVAGLAITIAKLVL